MQFRPLFKTHSFLLKTLLAALFLEAEGALAAGLGELTVRSHLGDRFLGEVTLIEQAGPANSEAGCFRLERSDEGDSGLPFLTHGRVRLERQNGQSKLVILSDQSINDPVLQIKLRVGCGTELVRSYTALIDPAVPQQGARTSPTPSPLSSLSGKKRQATNENPEIDFGSNGEAVLDKGKPLNIPETRRRTARPSTAASETSSSAKPIPRRDKQTTPASLGRMSDTLLISGDSSESVAGNGLPLRLSTELNTRLSRRVSENQRAMLRMEYQLLNTLYAQASAQLALADQIRALESNVEGMRTAYDTAARETEMAPSAPKSPSDAPAYNNNDAAPTEIAKTVPPKHGTAPAQSTNDSSMPLWLELIALLATVGLLTWAFLRRQKRTPPPADYALDDNPPPVSAAIDTSSDPVSPASPLQADDDATFEQTVVAPPPQQVPSQPSAPSGTIEFDEFHLPLKHLDIEVDESGDYTTTLELADIMVAFGRIKGATQTLEEYLEHSPRAALAPWLKLLELYRTNDMQDEFNNYSEKLRAHFNIAPLDWEEAATCFKTTLDPDLETESSIDELLQKLPAISAIQRIADGVRETWGTPDGFNLLKALLNDTRDGTRTGFTMQTARELLFLKKVLKTQLEHTP